MQVKERKDTVVVDVYNENFGEFNLLVLRALTNFAYMLRYDNLFHQCIVSSMKSFIDCKFGNVVRRIRQKRCFSRRC